MLVLLVSAYHFRGPFVAVAPIASRLRTDLDIGGGTLGVLTSLPVLCFGLAAPLALLVVRRLGPDLALVLCLVSVAVGAVVRSSGPFATVALGTLVIGLGITVGNIVVPVLIRRDVPAELAGMVTGAYVAVMNIGSMTVSLATAPLADAVGWRGALLLWGLLALVGVAAWTAYLRVRGPRDLPAPSVAAVAETSAPSVWRTPLAWLLLVAFAGQSASYYTVTAWLPSILHDELGLGPAAAGAASSVFQVCAIAGAIGVPALARTVPSWVTVVGVGLLWMCLPVILLVAPHLWLLATVLGGVAQGGGLASLFVAIVRASRSERQSARMSAFVQGGGYVVAALGPPTVGWAHDVTGGWTVPLLMVLGSTLAFTVFGTTASLQASRVAAAAR